MYQYKYVCTKYNFLLHDNDNIIREVYENNCIVTVNVKMYFLELLHYIKNK